MTLRQASSRRTAFGYVLAFFGALGLGGAIAVARIAYEGGAEGLTIAFPRAWLLVLLMLLFCRLTRRSLWLPRRTALHALAAGVALGYLFYGNIAAAEFVEAPVAALLFFIYPPLTTVIIAGVDRRWPQPIKLLATLIAFAGLAIMLGTGLGAFDWRGVALGLSSGIVCALHLVWISRALPPASDPVVTTAYMSVAAAVTLSLATLLAGGAPAPTTDAAWIATAAAGMLQACAIPLIYVALPIIGAERSAVFNNLQPVATIVAAYLLLGEALGSLQFLGGAMILGGIFLMQSATKR